MLTAPGATALGIVVAGLVVNVLEVLDATTSRILWGLGGVLLFVSACWLIAALQDVTDTANKWCGAAGAVLLIIACGILGWNTRAALASESLPAQPLSAAAGPSTPAPSGVKGTARITSPADGAGVATCTVSVRVDGSPAPGKAFLAVTKQQDADYYFESQVESVTPDRWSARVQVGQKDYTDNEDYTVSIYELDRNWIGYLVAVFAKGTEAGRPSETNNVENAAKTDVTYWNTSGPPPAVGEPLHSVAIHRTGDDDTCPS